MCTVLLDFDPQRGWPLFLGAIRDELLSRPWLPTARHWPGKQPEAVGGMDLEAGGTWLAVHADAPALALVLNRFEPSAAEDSRRPAPRRSRGWLPLDLLAGHLPDPTTVESGGYDGFYLLLATPAELRLWTWDRHHLGDERISPGRHLLVARTPGQPGGLDPAGHPRVEHFLPRFRAMPGDRASWLELMGGEGMAGDDPRALLLRRRIGSDTYGSSSASLVGFGPAEVSYEFTATPQDLESWSTVLGRALMFRP